MKKRIKNQGYLIFIEKTAKWEIMIPKSIIEKMKENNVYIYIRNIDREFSGELKDITNDNIILLQDKYNNLIHIPLDLVDVITERH